MKARVLRVVAAAVVIAVEIVGILVGVVAVIVVIGCLIEQSGAMAVIGTILGMIAPGADVVDAGIARQRTAGLIAPRARGAISEPGAVAEGLVVAAAHHPADAVEQQRSADHAGRGRGRRAEEGAATAAEWRLRPAIGLAAAIALTIGTLTVGALSIRPLVVVALIIRAGPLRLLQHLAAIPDRTAGSRRRHVRHRAL